MRFALSLWNIRGEGALGPQGYPCWNNLRCHSGVRPFCWRQQLDSLNDVRVYMLFGLKTLNDNEISLYMQYYVITERSQR